MQIVNFIFTAYKNSFCVFVKNLENLSVEQIQDIQAFVKKRNGIFDFNSYSFVIQKKIEFYEFEKLIQKSSIEANCIEKPLIKKQSPRVDFGEYKGLFYKELPNSYLLWLKNNYLGKNRAIIENELKNRNL